MATQKVCSTNYNTRALQVLQHLYSLNHSRTISNDAAIPWHEMEATLVGQKESRVLLSFELYLYKCFDWRQSHPSLRRNPQTGSLGPRENIQKMRRN